MENIIHAENAEEACEMLENALELMKAKKLKDLITQTKAEIVMTVAATPADNYSQILFNLKKLKAVSKNTQKSADSLFEFIAQAAGCETVVGMAITYAMKEIEFCLELICRCETFNEMFNPQIKAMERDNENKTDIV